MSKAPRSHLMVKKGRGADSKSWGGHCCRPLKHRGLGGLGGCHWRPGRWLLPSRPSSLLEGNAGKSPVLPAAGPARLPKIQSRRAADQRAAATSTVAQACRVSI